METLSMIFNFERLCRYLDEVVLSGGQNQQRKVNSLRPHW